MKTIVVFSVLLAVASASSLYLAPAPLLVPAVSNQYHSQDGIGQYAYGYNDQLSSKQETKSLNGITQGSYSYLDSNNVVQTVDYVADAGDFRVSATNLPKPVEAPVIPTQDLPKQVEETYEVAAAKAAHFAAIEEAKKQNGYQSSEVVMQAPQELPRPVEDTPEVAAAKSAHFAAIEEAKKQKAAPVVIPVSMELPRPVQDTPEVAKAKAEHMIAIEQVKLRNSYAPLPLIAAYSALPFPGTGGFSYSSSIGNYPAVQYVRYV
ncbi:cuticle protein 19.8-like [Eupeodes corollae]|uniref:cuticle protein 19.8-like n=1 Tax=Eupeodes corollae TaxID=290404 RepID=UPI00248F8F7D|nr:cuticle protein 19.8-like [Eupeodes corollae]